MGQESQIEKSVSDYARRKGCYTRKFSSPAHRGVPDRLFITPAGAVFFIEFKAPGEEPTPAQWREINIIRKNNGNAHWADSVETGVEIVNSYLRIKVQ